MTTDRRMAMIVLSGFLLWASWCTAQEDPNSVPLEQRRIVLNFQNAQISEVLDYLSETAGLVILSDEFVDGRVSLVSKQALRIDEVVALINTVLLEKEYAAIRTGRTLKLVPIGEAGRQNIPVFTGSDPEQVTPGDEMVTHIIPIRYVNAMNLQEDLSALLPEYAVLTANEASNSLIVTDTTAGIKRIMEIVRAVDTQMSAIADVKVFRLVYAEAETTANLINTVFNQDQASSRNNDNNPFARMMAFRGGPGGRGDRDQQGSDGSGGPNLRVIASADERTNAVVVSGPGDILEVIARVVKELDSNPDEERSLFVYNLKNARAENLTEVLNNLIQGLQEINQENVGGRGGASTRRTGNTTSDSGANDFSDETYIQSDPDTNSLLIMTSTKNYNKLKPVLEELDRPIPQVLIKCLLAEVTTANDLDLGTEFLVDNLGSEGAGFIETDLAPGTVGPSDPSQVFGSGVNSSGIVARIVEGDLSLTLRALQQIGELNVLSRPYILTSNNQPATITVGQEVPFVRNTQVTDQGTITNTVEYEDIGIILTVTPNINPEGLVIMDISPEISTISTETVPISKDLNAVVIAKRSSNSRVAIRNGQTIVIGGLMQDNNRETVNKVPLLGDIPLIGELFKRTLIEKEKTELLIFMTPQVAESDLELMNISNHLRDSSETLQHQDEKPELKWHIETQESVADTAVVP